MFNDQTSHPLRMRGLKQRMIDRIKKEMEVASFTDAWIETNKTPQRTDSGIVASFTDAWIETWWKTGAATWRTVASFTDAWIETTFIR